MKLIRNLKIRHKLLIITVISVVSVLLIGFVANYVFRTSDVVAYVLKGHRLHNVHFHAGLKDFYKYLSSEDSIDYESAKKHMEYADRLSELFGRLEELSSSLPSAEYEQKVYDSFKEAFDYDYNAAQITSRRAKLLIALRNEKFLQGLKIAREVNMYGREVMAYMEAYKHSPTPENRKAFEVTANEVISYEINFANAINDINADVNKLLILGIAASVLILGLFNLLISIYLSKLITKPIYHIVDQFSILAQGDLNCKVEIESRDEIGRLAVSINNTLDMLKEITRQANQIAEGDYTVAVVPRSTKDTLGIALQNMTSKLNAWAGQLENQDWLKNSLAKVNEITRGDKDLNELNRNILAFLVKALDANMGICYLRDENDYLRLAASYAYQDRKGNFSRIKIGEGIIGQTAVEKDIIEFHRITDDAPVFNNGLSEEIPAHLLTIPLLFENEVMGVILIGNQKRFGALERQLMEKSAEIIAIAINSTVSRNKIEVLLQQSREQTEKLQLQQEELRQTNEELEEQTQTLKASEAALQAQQEELRVTNEELEERTKALEKERDNTLRKNQELKVMQEEVEKKARDLEVASRYKSEFLANMSHELRTPLNSILVLSQLLADNKNGNLTDKQIEFSKTINSSGADLLSLINEILDLSKVESGRIELKIEQIRFEEIRSSMLKLFNPLAIEKGLSFIVDVAEELPPSLLTDEKRLLQILKNLISNAVKFTEKGQVQFRMYRPGHEVLAKSRLKPTEAVAFEVSDTGIGIPSEKQHIIFEAFKQVDGTTSRKFGGTGLGLTISRSFAELLGGEILVSSIEGKGSSFTLILPLTFQQDGVQSILELKNEKPVSPAVTSHEPFKSGSFLKPSLANVVIADDKEQIKPSDKFILIVEDDPNFASILGNLAHEKGFKFIIAHDGETGLHYADFYHPGAIILDIALPGIDGYEVMKRLRQNPNTARIPVHFMTAGDNPSEATSLGAIGFLTKPVSLEKMTGAFNKIEEVISRKVKKLLIIEDDEVMRNSIRELTTDSNIFSETVATGSEGLAKTFTGEFDCIILDLGLHDMSGFEFLDQVREHPQGKNVPVIVYTGRDLNQEEEEKLRKLADSIIIKGVKSPDRLLAETNLFLHRVKSDLAAEEPGSQFPLTDKESVLKDKKVLIVDDDMRNVFALSSALEEKGMQIVTARNGSDGLDKMNKESHVDLVIMDIMMPKMDGYEAIREIRKNPLFSKIPIIALTAKAMKDDREKCIAAGANDYLTKPVDISKLLSLLRVWLYK